MEIYRRSTVDLPMISVLQVSNLGLLLQLSNRPKKYTPVVCSVQEGKCLILCFGFGYDYVVRELIH